MMRTGSFFKERLLRLHKCMMGYVEREEVPGIVTGICRHGEVHVDAVGHTSLDSPDPMRRDTIFRIASMSKPITAAATMILLEEGQLHLDDAVQRWLPELADRKVLKRLDAPLDETVPAQRPITVRDLLTFTLGFGLLFAPTGEYPILKAASARQIGLALASQHRQVPLDPDEWIRRLGTLPLMYQPGERWLYGTGSDVLGVLIARISGQPLEAFLRERIFEPLGMKDTGFSVPADKLNRLASCYVPNPTTGTLELLDGVEESQWGHPPIFPSGATGLVSTLDDYLAFGQMMLNQGRYGRERILSRFSVAVMTADQLTPAQKAVSSPPLPGFFDTTGWGFGVSMVTRRDDIASVPGRFGWNGSLGTSWFSDPKEDLVGIVLTQRAMSLDIWRDFWTLAYQTIDD